MTPDTQPLSRREQDRQGYADAQRAAHEARTWAHFYENLAAQVQPIPEFGKYTEQAATVLRRGYCAMSLGLLDIAVQAEAEQADYRLHLTGERP